MSHPKQLLSSTQVMPQCRQESQHSRLQKNTSTGSCSFFDASQRAPGHLAVVFFGVFAASTCASGRDRKAPHESIGAEGAKYSITGVPWVGLAEHTVLPAARKARAGNMKRRAGFTSAKVNKQTGPTCLQPPPAAL